jgi:glucose-6-phosphate-specific signal transduction histidine kinase
VSKTAHSFAEKWSKFVIITFVGMKAHENLLHKMTTLSFFPVFLSQNFWADFKKSGMMAIFL